LEYVVGVDTHRDEHTLAVVEASTGVVVAQARVARNGRGYAQAFRFARQQADAAGLGAVEGAGRYGAGLVRSPGERGETGVEVGRSARGGGRVGGGGGVRRGPARGSAPLRLPRSGERQLARTVYTTLKSESSLK